MKGILSWQCESHIVMFSSTESSSWPALAAEASLEDMLIQAALSPAHLQKLSILTSIYIYSVASFWSAGQHLDKIDIIHGYNNTVHLQI